ncbi:MAG: FIG002473: Protein YcaR in KDO2-Lipid A biosynthesis cluster, partial [uncultured Pseudonocardia sp.]
WTSTRSSWRSWPAPATTTRRWSSAATRSSAPPAAGRSR